MIKVNNTSLQELDEKHIRQYMIQTLQISVEALVRAHDYDFIDDCVPAITELHKVIKELHDA